MKNMGAATGAGAWPKFTIDRIVCKRLAWPFDTIGRVDSWTGDGEIVEPSE